MSKPNTINIVKLQAGILYSIVSFKANERGAEEAEELLIKEIKKYNAELSDSEISSAVDLGGYESDNFEVLLIHTD